MLRPFLAILIACLLLVTPNVATPQDRLQDVERLRKELELRDREIDLLKRENELLKKENAALKKAGPAQTSDGEVDSVTRVAVDDVEYVYQRTSRNGNTLLVTVLATSKTAIKLGRAAR